MKDTPELDYQHLIIESGQSELLGRFYDWLRDNKYFICKWLEDKDYPDESGFFPTADSPEKIFAKFFGIDLNKIEEERRAILKELGNK